MLQLQQTFLLVRTWKPPLHLWSAGSETSESHTESGPSVSGELSGKTASATSTDESATSPSESPSCDLNHLKEMFPENDLPYLKRVLDDSGSVSQAVTKILLEGEASSISGNIDEIEDIPLAAVGLTTTDDSDALRKFIRSAVSPFGLEVDLQLNRKHDILLQMIRKYKIYHLI